MATGISNFSAKAKRVGGGLGFFHPGPGQDDQPGRGRLGRGRQEQAPEPFQGGQVHKGRGIDRVGERVPGGVQPRRAADPGEAEMHRPLGAGQHFGERGPEVVLDQVRAFDDQGRLGNGLEEGDVVEGGGAGILETAPAFPVGGHLSRDDQQGRLIGAGGGNRGDHIGNTGPADGQTGAEPAAGPGIAVGHTGGAAFVGGHNGSQSRGGGQGRQKGIHQAAGHQKDMGETFGAAGLQEIVGSLHTFIMIGKARDVIK